MMPVDPFSQGPPAVTVVSTCAKGATLTQRRYRVRRFVNNCDRAVVLPDNGGSPSPRRGDYDDYDGPRAAPKPKPTVPVIDWRYIPDTSRRVCPVCGREVKYNERRQFYYSHNLPDSVKVCIQSGRE
jgi:hypothetical protein